MKILAIGDFHGKFPEKLRKIANKENPDIIVSQGDFCGNKELNKLFFKYAYGKDIQLWQAIGKKKNNQLEKKNYEVGKKILEQLNNLNKKVIAVRGNWDPTNWADIGFPKIKDPYTKKFNRLIKRLKNIEIIDFKNYKFKDINFVGYPRCTYPGKITKHIERKMKKRLKEKVSKFTKKVAEDNKEYFNLFKKKFNNNTIFISHNCPYRTKLDKIKKGIQKGKHYGSYLAKKIIKELKPSLVICGHMHENQGECKIGRTLVINTGAAYEGKAAIIDFNEKKGKIMDIQFIK